MAVEISPNGGMTITGEHIHIYRYLTIVSGLTMTINTGMKMSNRYSPLTILREEGITNKRTNKGALRDLVAFIKEINPDYSPGERTLRAMA